MLSDRGSAEEGEVENSQSINKTMRMIQGSFAQKAPEFVPHFVKRTFRTNRESGHKTALVGAHLEAVYILLIGYSVYMQGFFGDPVSQSREGRICTNVAR